MDHASTNVVAAFSEEQTARLTGLSTRRLTHWQRTDFFTPSFSNDGSGPYGRLYTFMDVVCLRTIALLILEHNIGLPVLRETLAGLFKFDQKKWATETLYILGKRVYFEVPEGGQFQETTSKQLALANIPLRKVFGEVSEAVEAAKRRKPESIGKIITERGVMSSRPIIEGTRIPIQTILDYHRRGASVSEIIAEYPRLTEADIAAALEYTGKKVA